ncbi:MAG: hypothetical protein CMJ19_12470 [Phycisphaeraceae bacterium]|nr:hypothetical protein [Phycisphaeraceae bacterium]
MPRPEREQEQFDASTLDLLTPIYLIDLTIGLGEWIALMGPSGSGKTTLLNLLDGLDRPTDGRVHVVGQDLSQLDVDEAATFRRENIGLIFQQFHLVSYLTAVENVMLAQYYHSMVDQDEARHALERVQMADRADHLPSQLSGGEQQRVCIARALINDPKIILADEPTGNLDESNADRVVDIFQRLHREGRTLVVATHDPDLGGLAQRIVRLRHGQIVEECCSDGSASAPHAARLAGCSR